MARGITFAECVVQLRDEIGRDHDPSVGISDLPGLKQVIARIYEDLWDEVDWPHLRTEFDKILLQAGQRYYDLPTAASGTLTMNYERIEHIVTWYSGLPHRLERGITPEQYATYDSTTGVSADPALRYDIRFTGTKEQLEIWPIPSSTNQYSVQITGIPKVTRLVNDADVLMLDDRLVVLLAASEMLESRKAGDGRSKMKAAQQRLFRLIGRGKSKNDGYRIGMGNTTRMDPYKAIVRVR